MNEEIKRMLLDILYASRQIGKRCEDSTTDKDDLLGSIQYWNMRIFELGHIVNNLIGDDVDRWYLDQYTKE